MIVAFDLQNTIHQALFARLCLMEERKVYSSLPSALISISEQNCGWYSLGYGVFPLYLGSLMTEQYNVYSVQR